MNTIKFSSMNDIRKETSNVEVYSIKDLEINHKKYQYFSDAQISLYLTKYCNANCPFCVNKFEKRCVLSKEISDSQYYRNLEFYLDFFKDIKPWITITGGEPTISSRLVPTLNLLKEKSYKIRTFSTNGSHLLDIIDGKTILQHMLENNVVNNVDLSRMAIDDEENAKLMNIKVCDSNNEHLQKIASFASANSMEVRISCNLLKNGVHTLDDMLEFKRFYNQLGIHSIMFRELIPLEYDKVYSVDINNILEEIFRRPDFKLLRIMEGFYYTVRVYQYEDTIVKCYQEKEHVDKEVIREFVIYPDGKLDNGFNHETLMEVK